MTSVIAAVLSLERLSIPERISGRIRGNGVSKLAAIGSIELLTGTRTALLCSARTPGEAILKSHDAARYLRNHGYTVISGFHSPIEKECLKILLRGRQPIIICPARAIENMRIPKECRPAFNAGRILFLSPFQHEPRRVTRESAMRRNEIVAALADAAFIPHIALGGETARIADLLREWQVPIASSFEDLKALTIRRRGLDPGGDVLHV